MNIPQQIESISIERAVILQPCNAPRTCARRKCTNETTIHKSESNESLLALPSRRMVCEANRLTPEGMANTAEINQFNEQQKQ